MAIGVVGRKCGMTRVFSQEGEAIAVSVIHVEPNRVVRLKNVENDGYAAVQITAGNKKRSNLSRALAGEFARAGVEAGGLLKEFRIEGNDLPKYTVGDSVGVEQFEIGDYVDVQGVTIGKGFAGVVKRHHFRMQDATHGNSLSHRAPGSIGQNQTPGRVFKGKKMAGHLGAVRRTAQMLRIEDISVEMSVLLVSGAVPGPKGGSLIVNRSKKK